MKKIVLSVVCSLLTVIAGAWGLNREFVSQTLVDAQGTDHRATYTLSALYVLLRGGKTDFTVCIDDYASEHSFSNANQVDYLELLNQTLSQWITQVRSQIEESGRTAEFADILSWLPAQITLTPASCDKADILVKTIFQRPAGRNVWAYDSALGTWQLLFSYGGDALAEAWKETGSFWGLGILTQTANPLTTQEGRLENTADPQYSLYSVAEVHPAPGASVMWWKQPAAVSLTCDDVEGFINAVDFVQFMEGETSPRLENGWKSLCGHPYYYLRGRAAADEAGVALLLQETSQYRQNGKTLNTLQRLLKQWDTYHQTQVIPALSEARKSLAAQARPLDDKGLILSAQANHLEQVSERVFQAMRRIKEYAAHLDRCGGADCPALRAELDKSGISLGQDPLEMPELLQATPLKQDYASGQMHTCATCGQPIQIGKEYRDAAYERRKKKTVRYPYCRHANCPSVSVEQARTYRDHVTQVQAPTYAQLQTPKQTTEDLAARTPKAAQTEGTASLPFQDNIPAVLQRSIATSVAKAPVSATFSTAKALKPTVVAVSNSQAKQVSSTQQDSARLDVQCRVYLKVTAKEMAQFKSQYGYQLATIEHKLAKHQKLTREQKQLRQYYEQLLENEKITQECAAQEQAYARQY